MRWPLRYQLLLPLLTLLLGVVGISTWTAWSATDRARQRIEDQVRNVAHTLSEAGFPLHDRVLDRMKLLSGADFVLLGPEGPRAATLPVGGANLPDAETVVEDWQTLRMGPRVAVAGQIYLGSGVRLPPRAELPNGATLYILFPEQDWRGARWEAVRPSLLLGGFAGLAALTLAAAASQRLGRRVQELDRRTRQIAAGDFSPMRLPDPNDELRDLGQSVNEMAQQLARLQETVRATERLRLLGQVSGGLAHQLRNGLTGARLAVQLHARTCRGDGDAEALEVALRQLTLLEAHLKRFLDLGREGPRRREPCSLRCLVEDTRRLLGPHCQHARIELRWSPPHDDFKVLGDAGQLGQVLLNVLTNGVEAAGPGGWVEVALLCESSPPRAIVEISNSGPPPSADIADRLFELFVTGKPEGVGLGLAVARQVVEEHGGTIAWRRDGEVTRFRIELPLA